MLTKHEWEEIRYSIRGVPWHKRLILYSDKKREMEKFGREINQQVHEDLISAFKV